jgi:hypothetical protein
MINLLLSNLIYKEVRKGFQFFKGTKVRNASPFGPTTPPLRKVQNFKKIYTNIL